MQVVKDFWIQIDKKRLPANTNARSSGPLLPSLFIRPRYIRIRFLLFCQIEQNDYQYDNQNAFKLQ